MAEKRMFAKTIIDSDEFMEMPATAQILYFHLAMRADDDGFVNSPKRIMRMIGSGEDDMKLLIVKQFVIPFESGVVVIKHWKIHNYIRKDTYSETQYKAEKARLILDGNNAYLISRDESVTDTLQERNEPVTVPSTQDSIDKNRLDKLSTTVSNDTVSSGDDERAHVDYKAVVDAFNKACISLPNVREINDRRRKAIRSAAHTVESFGGFAALFEKVEASDFLTGRRGSWTGCGFDWILKPANLTKIIEGNYDNKADRPDHPDYTDTSRYTEGW